MRRFGSSFARRERICVPVRGQEEQPWDWKSSITVGGVVDKGVRRGEVVGAAQRM